MTELKIELTALLAARENGVGEASNRRSYWLPLQVKYHA